VLCDGDTAEKQQLLQHIDNSKVLSAAPGAASSSSISIPVELLTHLNLPALQLPAAEPGGADSSGGVVPLLCVKRTYQPNPHKYKRKHGFLKRWVPEERLPEEACIANATAVQCRWSDVSIHKQKEARNNSSINA